MNASAMQRAFRESGRPEVALITNHGYGGPEVPVGGAPDTGGQNVYVNALALALTRLGFRVTVFARGGFPHFGRTEIREAPEYLSDHVRYVFVPGGGERFLPKERIAIALDEQLEWLDGFVRREAAGRGCEPWEVYGLVNTHYWDAAVLGVALVERWRNDVAARAVRTLLDGVVPAELLEEVQAERHGRALGQAPGFHLGRILLGCAESAGGSLVERARAAASRWSGARSLEPKRADRLLTAVEAALARAREEAAPALHEMLAAEALGLVMLDLAPGTRDRLARDLERVDRHVWTPHSLGELKDYNFRGRPVEERRELRFCERRSHERMVCRRTRAFAATSLEIAEWLRTHYGVSAERIFYFPPCVDGTRFRPYSERETVPTYRYLAECSGVSEERLRAGKIVFETSRMDPSKRKDLLLAAFARAALRSDGVYLFVGGGPRNEVYEGLERQLDADDALRGKAFLTGFVPEEHVAPLFSLADIYASPSEMEGFGMSVAQAAASRTAVVTTELTPFSVQYAPEASRIVPAGDEERFAAALAALLEDDADRGRRARALAEAVRVLDWEAQAAAFLDHLRRRGIAVPDARSGA